MAQAIQIVPSFTFPYVETVINDYTEVVDRSAAEVTQFNQAYAVVCGKGIDNVWVKKSTRSAAVGTFGESNFKKYGQPYMQALHALEQDDCSVYIMRVMPENAAYSNAIVSAYYKADTAEEVPLAHERKFRIKLTSTSYTDITTDAAFKDLLKIYYGNGTSYTDGEGFKQVPFMGVRYSGRGDCGDLYSLRITQSMAYEKNVGIKLYDFGVINRESGFVKEADYVGGVVTSDKYTDTYTLINDVLEDTEAGTVPVNVYVDEEKVTFVYDEYMKFLKALLVDLKAEYENDVEEFNIPEDQLNGVVPVDEENAENLALLNTIEDLINDVTETLKISADEFDIIYGLKVASSDMLPAIEYPVMLTDDVDTTAEDYNAADYTTSTTVDFASSAGLKLENGANGYFDNPRTETDSEGNAVKYTVEDEITLCLNNAFNGVYDPKILSPRRMPITVFFDANYPFSVKSSLAKLALARNDARLYLDCGIIDTLSVYTIRALADRYSIFNDRLISTDIHNFMVKEANTSKRVNVTIMYYIAAAYVNHFMREGFHIPFVRDYAQLSGHTRDSLRPIVEDYQTDIKQMLNDYRFNYFECVRENVFQRGIQNTRYTGVSDLLEESNVEILYNIKRNVEFDVQSQIYNFADEDVRQSFVKYEEAKYADWNGRIVQSIEFSFATSQYEADHSIMHLYLGVTFRGLTKQVIVEIDINKRVYTSNVTEE